MGNNRNLLPYIGAEPLGQESLQLIFVRLRSGVECWIKKSDLVRSFKEAALEEKREAKRTAAKKPNVVGRRDPETKKILRYEKKPFEVTEVGEEMYAEND